MSQRKVLVLQHTPPETLGTIADSLGERGIQSRYIRPFLGDGVPAELGDASGLIVMGGPMSVHDAEELPYLRREMKLMERALAEKRPVLGVCLGSQMLASVLGAPVSRGKKEIGWYPVRLAEEAKQDPLLREIEPAFAAFHWHGEAFALPEGAIHLASSEATEHQIFRYGAHAYGLLFHLEVTENMIREMIRCFSDELQRENLDGGWIMQRWENHATQLEKVAGAVFGRWADLLWEEA